MYLPSSKLAAYRAANQPDLCPILHRDMARPVVDHDHGTGEVRGVISSAANTLIGKLENSFRSTCSGDPRDLPDVLRRIASYLEAPPSGVLHPKGAKQLTSRFSRLTSADQSGVLLSLGVDRELVESATNQQSRAQLYLKSIKHEYDREPTAGNPAKAKGPKGAGK